jgi:hypothetical protein
MILNLIIYILVGILSFLLGLLPDIVDTTGFAGAIATISEYLSSLSQILPIGTIIAIIVIDLTFETGYLAYKIIYWIIRRFPTQS